MEIRRLEHDIFLLMLNLAQLENQERIRRHFIEALNSIWRDVEFRYILVPSPSNASSYEIATLHNSYGYVQSHSEGRKFPDEVECILRNAARMLAIILENRQQAQLLADENLRLEAAVEWHMTDLQLANRKLKEEIAERLQAERALRDLLEEKVVLLKEVHHRVKNNLQIVASLMSLQANRIENREAIDALQDTSKRVRSIALLHETLYKAGNLACINFAAYVKDLCVQLSRSFGPESTRIEIESGIAAIDLDLEQAVPCGLIINELVSNAFKHAFPEGRAGKVTVEVKPIEEGRLFLCVRDDGVGLPPDMDLAGHDSLGLRLVVNLAGQLGGRLHAERAEGGGAAFHLIFPCPAACTCKDE